MNPDSLKAQIVREVRAAIADARHAPTTIADRRADQILALPALAALQAENTRLKALVELAEDALTEAIGFISNEADNRSAAKVVYSDYEREPIDLLERLQDVFHQIRESGK